MNVDSDKENNSEAIQQSSQDKSLTASLKLGSCVSRSKDAYNELETSLNNLDTVDPKDFECATNTIKNTILPLMDLTINCKMPDALKQLNTIRSVLYVHTAQEATVNTAAKMLCSKRYKNRSLGYKRMHIALKNAKKLPLTPKPPKRKAANIMPDTVTATATEGNKETDLQLLANAALAESATPNKRRAIIRIPSPHNNQSYTAEECVEHLYGLETRERRELIKKWIKAGLIPVSERAIYRRLDAHQDGKEIKPFHKMGRTKFITDDAEDKIVANMNSKFCGKKYKSTEIKEVIEKDIVRKKEENGLVSLQSVDPTRSTIRNYWAKLAANPKCSITTSTISKTTSRIVAENSVISAMCLVIAVASTHYEVTLEEQVEDVRRIENEATEGAKKLYYLLKEFYGQHVHLKPIKPCYMLSTDDTV